MTLESVVDAKGWMSDIIPALHDHLKAHQFKFERNSHGHTKMFYKEWSSDDFWLPQCGLSLLPKGRLGTLMLLLLVGTNFSGYWKLRIWRVQIFVISKFFILHVKMKMSNYYYFKYNFEQKMGQSLNSLKLVLAKNSSLKV